jgi:GNAT superfamily N-acetyltransferase
MLRPLLIGLCGVSSLWAVDLEVLQGDQINDRVSEIAQFCNELYLQPPYFYDGQDAGYEAYLQAYGQDPESIICLALDNAHIVGIAAGMPMAHTRPFYQDPLLSAGYSIAPIFYLGEFGLQPPYQGQAIEQELLEQIIGRIANYQSLCVFELQSSPDPIAWVPPATFWEENDFVLHPELTFTVKWTHAGDASETEHLATYWIRKIAD